MRVFKSKPYRHSERALKAATTRKEIDLVRDLARVNLKPKELGHFILKVQSRRQEIKNAAAGATNSSSGNG